MKVELKQHDTVCRQDSGHGILDNYHGACVDDPRTKVVHDGPDAGSSKQSHTISSHELQDVSRIELDT